MGTSIRGTRTNYDADKSVPTGYVDHLYDRDRDQIRRGFHVEVSETSTSSTSWQTAKTITLWVPAMTNFYIRWEPQVYVTSGTGLVRIEDSTTTESADHQFTNGSYEFGPWPSIELTSPYRSEHTILLRVKHDDGGGTAYCKSEAGIGIVYGSTV